jgi:hypothetical protein
VVASELVDVSCPLLERNFCFRPQGISARGENLGMEALPRLPCAATNFIVTGLRS